MNSMSYDSLLSILFCYQATHQNPPAMENLIAFHYYTIVISHRACLALLPSLSPSFFLLKDQDPAARQ